jgi:hypothetical protein
VTLRAFPVRDRGRNRTGLRNLRTSILLNDVMGEPDTRREFAREEVLSTVVPYVLRNFLPSSILSIAETVLKGRGQQPLLKFRGAPLRDNGRHYVIMVGMSITEEIEEIHVVRPGFKATGLRIRFSAKKGSTTLSTSPTNRACQ